MIFIFKLIKKLLRKKHSHQPIIDANYVVARSQHCLSKTDISSNALKVLNRLNSARFQAYLVGGSVRDLLLHKVPKDFDIATNAIPNQIKRLFRNARIIGRRFKLVHIIFYRDIIEVATFRKSQADLTEPTDFQGILAHDNSFGSLSEDAWRRDFTLNSLYYNLEDGSIIDFTGGVSDIKQRLIRIIGNPMVRYQEDPVRMLRAMRFSAKLDFDLEIETAAPIKKLSYLISQVPGARLFEEVNKLYQCGQAKRVHELLIEYHLFAHLFEQTYKQMTKSDYPVSELLTLAMENTDTRVQDNKPITPAFLLAILLWFPFNAKVITLEAISNVDHLANLEAAMSYVIMRQNKVVAIPKRLSQIMREIWLLQFRFPKRLGNRAFNLLKHPRFRAAYDFLALRALVGDENMELVHWWTNFQEKELAEQQQMVNNLATQRKKK